VVYSKQLYLSNVLSHRSQLLKFLRSKRRYDIRTGLLSALRDTGFNTTENWLSIHLQHGDCSTK